MKYLLTLTLLVVIQLSHAQQWDIGGGAVIAAPLIYSQQVGTNHHAGPGFNAEYTMRYLPPNLSFYPQLNISIGSSELPVLKMDNIVVQIYLLQLQAMLNARIVHNIDDKKELHYGMGLGAIYYESGGVSVALKGNNSGYVGDSRNTINGVIPAVNASAEFIALISAKKPVYCGIGGRLGYAYFSNKTATIDADISSVLSPGMRINIGPKGNMITPQLHISFYYRFGERY